VEELQWDAFNEGGTLIDSVEAFCRAYGHYPARVLADKFFRTRENLKYCSERGIYINGPKLGKSQTDEALGRQQLKEEWLESGGGVKSSATLAWPTDAIHRGES
jgi:hypothetical protein